MGQFEEEETREYSHQHCRPTTPFLVFEVRDDRPRWHLGRSAGFGSCFRRFHTGENVSTNCLNGRANVRTCNVHSSSYSLNKAACAPNLPARAPLRTHDSNGCFSQLTSHSHITQVKRSFSLLGHFLDRSRVAPDHVSTSSDNAHEILLWWHSSRRCRLPPSIELIHYYLTTATNSSSWTPKMKKTLFSAVRSVEQQKEMRPI